MAIQNSKRWYRAHAQNVMGGLLYLSFGNGADFSRFEVFQ